MTFWSWMLRMHARDHGRFYVVNIRNTYALGFVAVFGTFGGGVVAVSLTPADRLLGG